MLGTRKELVSFTVQEVEILKILIHTSLTHQLLNFFLFYKNNINFLDFVIRTLVRVCWNAFEYRESTQFDKNYYYWTQEVKVLCNEARSSVTL